MEVTEREPGNLRSGNRGGSEDARREVTTTSNRQPQPQDPTLQEDHRIMLMTRAKGRDWGGRRRGEEALEKFYTRCGKSRRLGRKEKRNVYKKRTGSVDVDPEDLDNRNKTGRKAQGAQGLRTNCRDSLSRLIRRFRNKYH